MLTRVLDFDASLMAQPVIRKAVASGEMLRVNMRREGPGLRLWASRKGMAGFADLLNRLPKPGKNKATLTFLGSGDFHHLSSGLLNSFLKETPRPISLLHFDNHPDWVRFPPAFHCGSWINRVLENPLVTRVITVGPCGNDLHRPYLRGGNLPALAAGRLEIHPWKLPAAMTRPLSGAAAPASPDRGKMYAAPLAEDDWEVSWRRIINRVPQDPVWISIDKDVFGEEDAVTNWDQGQMPLCYLEGLIQRLAVYRKVAGVDICGDWSPPVFDSLLKRVMAFLDHPDASRGRKAHPPAASGPGPGSSSQKGQAGPGLETADESASNTNSRTNSRLLMLFKDILS